MSEGKGKSQRSVSPALIPTDEEERVIQALLAALRRLQHGSIQIFVQDRRVVQIDTVEKTRFRE